MSEFSGDRKFFIVKQMYAIGGRTLTNQYLHLLQELRILSTNLYGLLNDYRYTIKFPAGANNPGMVEEKTYFNPRDVNLDRRSRLPIRPD